MAFKTKTGTFPNRSGIQQIPGGARAIPQSYLNSIGRNIDAVRLNWQHAMGATQTAGGLQFEELHKDFIYTHPFKVEFIGFGEGGTSAVVTIKEGRIHGRIDRTIAAWNKDGIQVPSLGVNSVNNINSDYVPDEEEPEPTDEPSTENGDGTLGSGTTSTDNGTFSNNGSNTTGGSTTTVAGGNTTKTNYGSVNYSAGVYHQGLMGSQFSNKAGNAASITGNTGSTFHQGLAPSKTTRASGNAGSITGNTGSTFHTVQKSGNAGTIIVPTQ